MVIVDLLLDSEIMHPNLEDLWGLQASFHEPTITPPASSSSRSDSC